MLYLDIESYQKNSVEHPVSMQLDDGILTIGRDLSNTWCLPDPGRVLSKQHCKIEHCNGQYQLTDTSTNGVYLNDSAEPLGRGNTSPVQNGDRIRLSDYELKVRVEAVAPAPSAPIPQAVPQPAAQLVHPAPPPPVASEFEGQDWKSILEGESANPNQAPSTPEVQAVDVPDMTQSHYDAPSVGVSIPEDWGQGSAQSADVQNNQSVVQGLGADGPIPDNFMDMPTSSPEPDVEADNPADTLSPQSPPQEHATALVGEQPGLPGNQPEVQQAPAITPQPVMPESAPDEALNRGQPKLSGSSVASDDLLKAFLTGAGLDPDLPLTHSPEDMMQQIGGLFRTATMGLMGVLAARGDIKSEFRLSQTMIKPTENNPLKFSLNIDEAMVALLNKQGQGYMSAEAAFDEAFADLKGHQVAVLTGMQSALKSLLQQLDPANIQGQDGEVTGVKKLLGGQKAQYWDDFVLLYKTLFQKTEDDFQTVFGHEFAKAYEEQIRKQKSND